MHVLWRVLGLQLLAELVGRLPAAQARLLGVVLLLTGNLLPLAAVLLGWATAGDVLVAYWVESMVVCVFGAIRSLTSRVEPLSARWLPSLWNLLVWGGAALFQGFVTRIVVERLDQRLEPGRSWWWLGAALFVSHLLALGLHWFGRGARDVVGPAEAMLGPFIRIMVLQVTLFAALVLTGFTDGDLGILLVALLVLVKACGDVLVDKAERATADRARKANR